MCDVLQKGSTLIHIYNQITELQFPSIVMLIPFDCEVTKYLLVLTDSNMQRSCELAGLDCSTMYICALWNVIRNAIHVCIVILQSQVILR